MTRGMQIKFPPGKDRPGFPRRSARLGMQGAEALAGPAHARHPDALWRAPGGRQPAAPRPHSRGSAHGGQAIDDIYGFRKAQY